MLHQPSICILTLENILLQNKNNQEVHVMFLGKQNKYEQQCIYHHYWLLLLVAASLPDLWRWPRWGCSNCWSTVVWHTTICIFFPGHCLSYSKYLQSVWICVLISLNQIFITSMLMGLVEDLINLQVVYSLSSFMSNWGDNIPSICISCSPYTESLQRNVQSEPSLTLFSTV